MQGGMGFGNRWGGSNNNYMQMNGFQQVDYSQGWGNHHDQRLQQNIQMVFQRYDGNHSGQLEGQEFFNAYRDLCLSMGMAPPNSYQEVWQAVQQCDQNRDGRVSQQEMYMLFKNIQGVHGGGYGNQGYGQQGYGGGHHGHGHHHGHHGHHGQGW